MQRLAALVVVLVGAPAVAEPEGYQGGTGRPPGTPYATWDGGLTVSVRSMTIEATHPRRTWWCGGTRQRARRSELVTIVLDLANPGTKTDTTSLPLLDLVLDPDVPIVLEGACDRDPNATREHTVGANKHKLVRVRFLVPRGAVPKILVYNDDDFPALFALPAPSRARRR